MSNPVKRKRDVGRKYKSGSLKRKLSEKRKIESVKLRGALNNFFKIDNDDKGKKEKNEKVEGESTDKREEENDDKDEEKQMAKNASIGGRQFVDSAGGCYLLKKTRTGQAADTKTRWKYGDNLEYLHPFMKDKERLTSVTTENPSVSTINDEDTEYDTQLTEDIDASEDPQVSQDSEASYTPNASQILIIFQDETLLRDSQSNLQVNVPQKKTPKRAKSNVKVSTHRIA
ncbi:hypothetical protein FQA39_LY01998 [Lamprigera yunnana]|nr:hypothetical protein FQA39_LY01998 [Lamprigera yunnana]